MGLSADVLAGDVAAKASGVRGLNRLTINLGQQNVRDCVNHVFWRAFQKVRDSRVDLRLPHADGVVHAGEGIELHPELGHRCAWPQLAVGALEDLVEIGPQVITNLSRGAKGSGARTPKNGHCSWRETLVVFGAVTESTKGKGR